MVTLHENSACRHDDLAVITAKRLQNAGRPHEVLQEIHRFRADNYPLSAYKSTVLETHEIGALAAIGAISIKEFVEQIYGMAEHILQVGGEVFLADVQLWMVRWVVRVGELELARSLNDRFYDRLPRNAVMRLFSDTASIYIRDAEGDLEGAIALSRACVARIDRAAEPCLFEAASVDLVGLLLKAGRRGVVRTLLRRARIPADRIGAVIAQFE